MAMEMGFLEVIVDRNGGPITTQELAKVTIQDEQLISEDETVTLIPLVPFIIWVWLTERVLRVLTSRDVLVEREEGIHAANDTTMLLNTIAGRTEEKYL